MLLATQSTNVSPSSGRTGTGNRRFDYKTVPGGSSCKFAGLSFDIVEGRLKLLDDSFPVDDKPTLIVVDSAGEIDALVELPVDAPSSSITTR